MPKPDVLRNLQNPNHADAPGAFAPFGNRYSMAKPSVYKVITQPLEDTLLIRLPIRLTGHTTAISVYFESRGRYKYMPCAIWEGVECYVRASALKENLAADDGSGTVALTWKYVGYYCCRTRRPAEVAVAHHRTRFIVLPDEVFFACEQADVLLGMRRRDELVRGGLSRWSVHLTVSCPGCSLGRRIGDLARSRIRWEEYE
ncbi:hypothetical protein VTK56DRAFT_3654 [Thermocarpiscus australiensis]